MMPYTFTRKRVFLKSGGMGWRPIVHIADISRAFLAAIEAPRQTVHSQIFNVGMTTENYRVREIAEIVQRIVPGSSITYADGAGPDKRSYRVDCSKIAMQLPKFRPQWTADTGANELYARYSEFDLAPGGVARAPFQPRASLKPVCRSRLLHPP